MAASQPKEKLPVEEKLRMALLEETERRYRFSEQLQQLLVERNERETVGETGRTVEELTRRMGLADDTITAQLRDLCLEPASVSRREKGEPDNQERDSGYSPSPATSSDLESAKRRAVILRASAVPALEAESPKDLGLPEMIDRPSLSTGLSALEGHVAGEPTEHSDVSPQDDSG